MAACYIIKHEAIHRKQQIFRNEGERMKTSIIGYPRVGSLRELKFQTEKYFRQEITEEALQKTARQIRQSQWQLQAVNGIDFIPSNDFSFYDLLLDTAVLFNIIPERYRNLGLSELDTYFALERGYQGDKGDVKALPMKKWFNTNYHYLVPEIDDQTEVKLVGKKPFLEYEEAKELEIETQPVVIGPFTLLKKLRYVGSQKAEDYVQAICVAYQDLLKGFQSLGTGWVQLDEPNVVYDLSQEDIHLLQKLYSEILAQKGEVKVLVQTYFGDVRDCYEELLALDFDGIGLDFVEGRQNFDLLDKHSFPKDKLLFSGLINGKNIWRNNYQLTLEKLQAWRDRGIKVVLNTSSSLLHVPYSLKYEEKLKTTYRKHFAFAEEKLEELRDLKALIQSEEYVKDARYLKNQALFENRPDSYNPQVRQRTSAITEDLFTRQPAFGEREKIQKKAFNGPILPTTTIGSFPQTQEVKKNRSDFKKGKIDQATYEAFNRQKIKECIALQEELGLDVLVHGEFERNDMVEYFGEQLDGYVFTQKAWVQSYGTRCVKPPIIWGDISRSQAMTVKWTTYAASLTEQPVKGMLTGPVTILNWSFPREDISLKESAYQIALAIRDEVLDLEAHGIKIIQVDEAALREKLPLRKSDWYSEYLDWAIPAFRMVHSGVQASTQIHTHMCYSEFTDIIPAIDAMDADVITFEASRSNLLILDGLKANHFQTEVGPGVYDIHSPRVPSVEEIKTALYKMLDKIPIEKLWVNPDCGLKTRGEKETKESLSHLVQAVKEVRNENKGSI